jgi:hypothetical protein
LAGTDIPWTVDGPYFLTFHDRDVATDIGSAERLLTSLGKGVRYMTAAEYCGYLHARIERVREDGGSISFSVYYDDHYCKYFASQRSTWILHLSDETRRSLGKSVPEKQRIEIPAGLGHHIVRVAPGDQ